MTKFTIKYLFELYPNIDFEEEFVISQDVQELNVLYESQATKEILPHVFDTANKKRLIQSIKKQQYEVIFILSRNIDAARLSVGTVTAETSNGETFLAHDIELTHEKVAGSLDYRITLKFYRYDTDIINHLSSENALIYKTGISAVNTINYKVQNPSYVFNNVTVYAFDGGYGTYGYEIKVSLNDLTDTINVDDKYYVHTNSITYNDFQDVTGTNLNIAVCYKKDTDYVYFYVSADEISSAEPDIIVNNLILDHEYEYVEKSNTATVSDKEIEFNIYTFINPLYQSIETSNENIQKKDDLTYTDKTISYKELLLNFWLTESNLYLKKYLSFASEITITLSDGTVYLPIVKTKIINEEQKPELIRLFEYSFKAKYEYMVIPNLNTY